MKKKVGVHRLADRAKVSIGTVDRALHGRPGIHEKTRERVFQIAKEPGYEPDLAARDLSKSRAHLRIGVCIPREIDFSMISSGRAFAASFPEFSVGGQIAEVIEGHEDEAEYSRKVSDLLIRIPDLAGIYVNTVNCLPVRKALEDRGMSARVKLITTDLFTERVPYFERHSICASIYQRPFQQGRNAINAIAEHLIHDVALASTNYFNPSIVLRSNLHLFREVRRAQESVQIRKAAVS